MPWTGPREKLERATAAGATAGVVASDDDGETSALVWEATGGGAEFAFEAIGLARTIELTVGSVRTGGTAVLVGMTPFGVRASFDAFDLVDRSIRILGSNYGFTVGALDFPRYAALHLAGPVADRAPGGAPHRGGRHRDAFDAMRRGEGARRVIVH